MKRYLLLGLLILLCASIVSAQESYGLKVGTQVPDFEATTYRGKTLKLSDYYKQGPVVLIFYRGGWCHYCNLQLQDYQAHLNEFEDLGASIVAVSVDKIENAAQTVKEKELGFEVVSNPEANLLELYNAVYQVPEDLAQSYKEEYNIDLQAASGRDDRIIAISSTYVIDQSGKIIFVHADEDYTNRKYAEEIIEIIKNLTP